MLLDVNLRNANTCTPTLLLDVHVVTTTCTLTLLLDAVAELGNYQKVCHRAIFFLQHM